MTLRYNSRTRISESQASASTSGTGEDDLMSEILPQSSNDNFTVLNIIAAGTKTNANGDKTLKFHFGASEVTFHPATGDILDWRFEAKIVMQSDTDHRCTWVGHHASTTHGYDVFTDNIGSGDLTLKVTGECANASDTITQTTFVVELI